MFAIFRRSEVNARTVRSIRNDGRLPGWRKDLGRHILPIETRERAGGISGWLRRNPDTDVYVWADSRRWPWMESFAIVTREEWFEQDVEGYHRDWIAEMRLARMAKARRAKKA